MIQAILFDLDGTLLPMDQDLFIKQYLSGLAKKMQPFGYDPMQLTRGIWQGTAAMVSNDGNQRNEEVFWNVFSGFFDADVRKDEAVFQDFYRNEFQQVQHCCGFDPRAAQLIQNLNKAGYQLILATNPLFPAIATHSRVKWAGLEPSDFSYISTYENSHHSKPNPDYYREILDKLHIQPENCLMVGNDVTEDMVAQKLGIHVFLLTDCLINKEGKDISCYPQGSFPELQKFIGSL